MNKSVLIWVDLSFFLRFRRLSCKILSLVNYSRDSCCQRAVIEATVIWRTFPFSLQLFFFLCRLFNRPLQWKLVTWNERLQEDFAVVVAEQTLRLQVVPDVDSVRGCSDGCRRKEWWWAQSQSQSRALGFSAVELEVLKITKKPYSWAFEVINLELKWTQSQPSLKLDELSTFQSS